MRRARERGSICLYVAVCLISMGLLTAAVVPLATSYAERITRRNDELRARMAFEAGVAQMRSQSLGMTLVTGSALNATVNGAAGTLNSAANDAQLANSLLVTGTMVRNGRSYRYSRVIGARQPSPFLFALMSKTDVALQKATLGANGVDGDAFSDGKLVVSVNGSTINGNLAAVTTVSTQNDTVVTGRTLPAQTSIAWPTVTASNYANAAFGLIATGKGLYVPTNATVTSVAFPSFGSTTDYGMWYYGGTLTISGTISGRGTIYVAGNLTISGNLRYATASDGLALIVQGNVAVASGVDTIDGYYFTNGSFTASKDLTVSRGGLVANAFAIAKGLAVVRDDAVMNDTTEAARLRLPYYWP